MERRRVTEGRTPEGATNAIDIHEKVRVGGLRPSLINLSALPLNHHH